MKRRDVLPLGLLGMAALPGCSPPRQAETTAKLEGEGLVPVQVEEARQIRVITGLRPFRPSGFVVRRDEFDGKSVIHNYGHGGGGFTLSWGSAHLAVELAGAVAGQACAVIGGGVMGLSVARLLQARGAKVTIYTRDLPPDTTSNVAGAQCWPVSVFDESHRTEAFGAQYVAASRFSLRYFQHLVGPHWGVRWIPNYFLSHDEPKNSWVDGPGGVLHDKQIDFRDFGPGEHAFPSRYVRRFHTMLIEPATYLNTLQREVILRGGQVEIRSFSRLEEVLALPESLLFNCSGLGARTLFNDEELIPIRGQLNVMLPQAEVNYNIISGNLYMFPRSDGIILGGSFQRNHWDTSPDDAISAQLIEGHRALFAGFK